MAVVIGVMNRLIALRLGNDASERVELVLDREHHGAVLDRVLEEAPQFIALERGRTVGRVLFDKVTERVVAGSKICPTL